MSKPRLWHGGTACGSAAAVARPAPAGVPEGGGEAPSAATPVPTADRTPHALAIDLVKVKAQTRLGAYHLARGECDAAIAACQEGLKLDPFGTELRQKLARAIKAGEAENKILPFHGKCAAPVVPVTPPEAAK